MYRHKLFHAIVGAALVVAFTLSTPASARFQNAEPVTLYMASTFLALTLDPQKMEDTGSAAPIENLFLGLTDIDPKTSEIRPEAATKWEHNDAGNVWVFTLRSDIPWVRWDPRTKKATEIRKVTAADFVYGIQRSCDPRLESYYTGVAAAIVKGCNVVAKTKKDKVKDSDFDQVGVRALSDTQLEITTQGNFGYFLYISSLWMFRAVPKEVIGQYGERWTDPGTIVTDGPFVVDLFYPTKAVFVRNPLYPKDVNDDYGGNVERVNMLVIGIDALLELYQADQIDTAPVAAYQLDRIKKDAGLSKQLLQRKSMSVFFFGFMYDKPPFDKVGVRRAFSAVIDRKAFAEQFKGTPIAHFMPPGIHGAVGIDEVGLGSADNPGFDPEYAQQQFAEAGYAGCKGFPQVNVLTFDLDWARFLQNAVTKYLGCPPGLINIREQLDFGALLRTIKPSTRTDARPHVFTLGWAPDYPDAQNWMHDVLGCNVENDFKRPCDDAIDGKIDAASREPDDAKRLQMYRELEETFFGKGGEFPIAPLFIYNDVSLVKPWYTGPLETDGVYTGAHWNTYTIDQQAQLAARTKG